MSDQDFWSEDWMALQQRYWQEWSELSRKAVGAGASRNSPWEQAQAHWWQAISPAATDVAREFMGKMMEQGRQFFHLAEMFSGAEHQQGGGAARWSETLDRLSADIRSAFAGGGDGPTGQQTTPGLMGFWELPLDNWQRMVSALSLLPGNPLSGMLNGGNPPELERIFSAPGIGYTREGQAQQQKLMRLLLEYRQAQEAYARFFSDTGVRAVERMREALQQRAAQGEVIDSARLLYDTWVATCEGVYSEQTMTPEYAGINGRLVNALMAVKHQIGTMVDQHLGSLGMPTRKELRTLQARMQENRRENKALRAEIETLRGQLLQLAKESRPDAPPRHRTAAGKRHSSVGGEE